MIIQIVNLKNVILFGKYSIEANQEIANKLNFGEGNADQMHQHKKSRRVYIFSYISIGNFG